MRNFGNPKISLSSRAPTPAGFDAGQSNLLKNVGPYTYSAYDACRQVLYNYTQKFIGKKGAIFGGLPGAARAIASAPDPLNSYYSLFIREYARVKSILPASVAATAQEQECMQVIWWLEGEYAKDPDNIPWAVNANANVNANATTNVNLTNSNTNSGGSNGSNGDDAPFYKQTWFVALSSVVVIGGGLYIGYNRFVKKDDSELTVRQKFDQARRFQTVGQQKPKAISSQQPRMLPMR